MTLSKLAWEECYDESIDGCYDFVCPNPDCEGEEPRQNADGACESCEGPAEGEDD